MKKGLLVTVIVVFGCAVLFLIMQPKQVPESSNRQATERNATPDIIRLRFGHDMPEGTAQHISALRFADIVRYKSKGRVHIEVFPNQQLGTDQQMVAMASAGELAITLPPTSKITSLVPELQVLDLPFLFPNREDLYDILDGVSGRSLLEKLSSHGLIGVSFWESGFKHFTANRPIHRPEDFQGLNIRVMKSQVIMDQFKAFGANPVPIDFHKTYQALGEGGVAGQENPLVSIVNMKFYEVQPHLTLSNHAYLAHALVFSKQIFESLPQDIQKVLEETAREITYFERKEIVEQEQELIEFLKSSGLKVYTLTKEERRSFEEASRQVAEKFAEKHGEILNMITRELAKKRQTLENEIVIGLNADLVSGSALSGLSIKRGMEIAVQEINQAGGVLGRQLKIIARDNSGISARGRDNMEYFSTVDNLVAVMCGIYSPIALAELDIVHREKIIFLDPWAAATKIVDNGYEPNFVFRVSVRDQYAGPFLINKAMDKYRKIALLLVDDGWGHGNEKGMTAALAKQNIAPVAVEWFNWGEKDMSMQLDAIEQAGAEAIILVAGAVEGATIIKNMAPRAKKLPIISHWGITGGHFWKAVNRELEKVSLQFLQSFSFYKTQTLQSKKLMNTYFQKYEVDNPGKIFAPVGTAHAYDLVHLLALAVKAAGTTDRSAVRNELERIEEFQGVVRHYRPPFTPTNHDALDSSSFFLAEYDEQGYIKPVSD